MTDKPKTGFSWFAFSLGFVAGLILTGFEIPTDDVDQVKPKPDQVATLDVEPIAPGKVADILDALAEDATGGRLDDLDDIRAGFYRYARQQLTAGEMIEGADFFGWIFDQLSQAATTDDPADLADDLRAIATELRK